jgi:UDP:flavonoid glycosyltransferase YjiC (YdhE family)
LQGLTEEINVKVLLIPHGSHGDVHPFVGLGLAFRARGHQVTVITAEYFEKLVRRVGLDFVPIGLGVDFDEELKNPDLWHPRRGILLLTERSIFPAIRPVYQAVAERYVPGETVVAAGSLAFGARIAQEKLGVPLATVHLQPQVFRSCYRAPVLPGMFLPDWMPVPLKRAQYWLLDRLFIDRVMGRGINAFRAELGLPPATCLLADWWNSPQRVLGLFPDWYAPPQPDWPPQLRLTGFPLYDESGLHATPADVETFLAAGEPPLVFTPGSANRHARAFFTAAVEACGLLGRRGLLLTRFAENVPDGLPESMRHVEYLPFSQVLPRAAALVHHGGIGTTAQGLAAGVPQLVMPLAYDQTDNAERLRRLGVGRALPPARFRGPAVAGALAELLAPADVAAHCRELAGRARQGNALEEGCRWIEELAEARVGVRAGEG